VNLIVKPMPAQMSVIMMNLFCGPPMFRSAVIATGEARALQLPSQSNDINFPTPK
jgi:hypothetical protein